MFRGSRVNKQPDYRVYLLHILALSGFALVQPILDLLGDNADFFVARGSQTTDLYALVAVLVFGLTLLLAGPYKLLSKISIRGLQLTHHVWVAALVGVIFLPVLKKYDLSDGLIISTAAGLGILFTWAYYKFQGLRMFVSALSPVSFVFAGFFLFGASARELSPSAEAGPETRAGLTASDIPVVMVIFDEFALTALMDADRNIDKTIFPNFHQLSINGSWYRNATTVATSTMLSVPAILTGNYPKAFISQSYQNYPNTLFTMLADSHRMNIYESTTSLCSPELCPDSLKQSKSASARIKILLADISAIYLHIISPASISSRLPVINMTWENYWQLSEGETWHRHNYGGRLVQLDYFVNSIAKSDPPGLHFVHTNFPHLPYQYLPSGNRYQGEWEIPGLDFSTDHWGDNQWMITQAYQRFMLQAATADLVLGKLIDRLKSVDIYEQALIIIVADHGVSFYPDSQRRDAPPFSVLDRDVLPVPLFIKYPFQKEGQISDENVETIDILPTISDVLGAGAELNMDGRSLLGRKPPRPEKLAFHAYKDFLQYTADSDGEAKYDTLKWKLQNFKHSGGIGSLFKIGKYSELVGSRLADLDITETRGLGISLDMPELYIDVNLDSGFLPSRITGAISFKGARPGSSVAVAVNGFVQAVTEIYPSEDSSYKFSAMVAEKSFKKGKNSLSAFLISADSDGNISLLGGQERLGQVSGEADLRAWVLADGKILGNKSEIPINPESLRGDLEYARVDGGTIEFFGWAMDVAARDIVDRIVIFEDGQYVYSGVTGMPREEGALYDAAEVLLVGFQIIIPENLFRAPGNSDIRLFAISRHGYAAELKYFDEYAWRDKSR